MSLLVDTVLVTPSTLALYIGEATAAADVIVQPGGGSGGGGVLTGTTLPDSRTTISVAGTLSSLTHAATGATVDFPD